MTKYYMLPITTMYWKPGEKYLNSIINAVEKRVADGDFVVISEKALSTALGKIVDESCVSPGFGAKLICRIWMQIVWGYFLGVLCHFGQRLLRRLREFPLETGNRHKQVAIQQAGLLQALMWGSEGSIDGSNLPYSYVSLPLNNSYELAEEIHQQIWRKLKKKVYVIIVDTDKTYSFKNFHFTPRPKPMKGIHSFGGVSVYIIGRAFKLKRMSTPLAVAGNKLHHAEALKIANMADRARGPGSGATVWDMASRFNVAVAEVSWDMLSKIRHKPIVIVRKK
ncbi:MAG: coenzyme F420-0:L-glutamate ligase [Candidatus Bathyarchaeota archaeon]|nr:MAG: coenzyme F420-0:L-glutamate ligase [Candidatus Bathyarchaeota archaeon]